MSLRGEARYLEGFRVQGSEFRARMVEEGLGVRGLRDAETQNLVSRGEPYDYGSTAPWGSKHSDTNRDNKSRNRKSQAIISKLT